MTITSRLNIIAVLTSAALMVLLGLLWYNSLQLNRQLEQIEQVESFSRASTRLNIVTEQYLAYGEQRYLDAWELLFDELEETQANIGDFPSRQVDARALPSIHSAFELIRRIRSNPETWPDETDRERLLDRAQSRIRSDIQQLLTVSHRLAETRRASVREIQSTQRRQFFFILFTSFALIGYLHLKMRKRIIHSLQVLLEGTKHITKGDLNRHIHLEGKDEHRQLAEEFNTMTKNLRGLIQQEQQLRKKAEDNEKRWEKLVEQAPNPIMISIDGQIKFVNPAGVALIGAESSDQILGASVYDFLNKADMDKVLQRIHEVQAKARAVPPTIYRIKTLDGQERYLQVESRPITYAKKQALQTVGLDITEHVKYERELQASLEEKTILLKEIHHRVKNNLAVISGLIQLQAMESDNELVRTQLNDSQMRIYSMALIHELLYESGSFSKLSIKTHINKLVDTILEASSHKTEIRVEYRLEDIVLNINQAIPCALILNELVTNSIKHGLKDRDHGAITVELHEEDGHVYLAVRDDGSGLPDDFNEIKTHSLGIRIMETLARQLKTSMEYHPETAGTRISIRFRKESELSGAGSHYLH